MERREYFIPPLNQVNFQLDVPFEKLGVSEIITPSDPSSSDVVLVRVTNNLGKNSIRVITDAGNLEIPNSNLFRLQKNTKLSIVRANSSLYNIRSIKIYDENDVLVEESTSNTFDFTDIDKNYRIDVDSYDVVQTGEFPSFISPINQGYVWNTEYSQEFILKVNVSNSTQFVRYYFPNQIGVDENGSKRITPNNNEVLINLSNPNALGRFELVIIAGNGQVGERDELRTFIDVIREKTYGEPDVTQIIYDKNIIEADLRPLDFNFEFDPAFRSFAFVKVCRIFHNHTLSPISNDLLVDRH